MSFFGSTKGLDFNGDVTTDTRRELDEFYWVIGLLVFSVFIIFFKLGEPAFFEPDEGRNAEVAREILLVKDWVTPHYDFIPRLDKPVFFYWLIALSYKVFGVSEWSARLPSAIFALGTLVLVYLFSRKFLGVWEALWSTLILLSSVEFFILSRIVIFEMALTFFITLGLVSFYWAQHPRTEAERTTAYLVMYGAVGAATLIKGAIGFVLPGMVILSYLLVTRKWFLLRHMALPLGSALFLVIAVPWYVLAEIKNPGYLRYFLLEEHLLRFSTGYFHRSGAWYYFIPVLVVGFFPWIALFPTIAQRSWQRPRDSDNAFLILWALVPFLFFSFSASKLPHYILPIFPALAILAAKVTAVTADPHAKRRWLLWLPALALLVVLIIYMVSLLYPYGLPQNGREILQTVFPNVPVTFALGLLVLVMLHWIIISKRLWSSQEWHYLLTATSFALVFLMVGPLVVMVSHLRSSKELAEKSAHVIPFGTQVAIYDAYLASLPFYLHTNQPIWVISARAKHKIMGSAYVAEKRPEPVPGYRKVLFTYEEFVALWKQSERPLIVFVQKKDLPGLAGGLSSAKKILQAGDMTLIGNGKLLEDTQ
jgi:4-amino-4-deoxy-L-arabinose transferase-like glycosyltransferase